VSTLFHQSSPKKITELNRLSAKTQLRLALVFISIGIEPIFNFSSAIEKYSTITESFI